MMDLREATKTLNAYSALIVFRARFCDKPRNPAIPEEEDAMEEMIAALKVETRQALVISILISRNIVKHQEQLVIRSTDELTGLSKALSRSFSAIQEAHKATLSHEEKFRTKEPQESPSARGIREFLARRRRPSN